MGLGSHGIGVLLSKGGLEWSLMESKVGNKNPARDVTTFFRDVFPFFAPILLFTSLLPRLCLCLVRLAIAAEFFVLGSSGWIH